MEKTSFSVGTGIYDITGPAAEIGMMGYAMLYQRTKGIHMRLRSRAFVIASEENNKRIAFVCTDLGMIFQAVKLRVIEKLKALFGNIYTDENVLLTATHTHSGPGGFSHYMLYNLTTFGFDKQNFDVIVEGIFQSIVRAHMNLAPAIIKINEGDLLNTSTSRAKAPYMRNPEEERDRYQHDVDKKMTLLRFERPGGREIGELNWFAVHATNIGNINRLISGDNKGYAAYLFERMYGTDYLAPETFIAAFTQSNAGDVTPNLWGYPDGIHDYEHMETIGRRQFEKALELYQNASEPLEGTVDYRHAYVDMSDVAIDPKWVNGLEGCRTAKAAIGMSMLAGSTEDGKGIPIPEGLTFDGIKWPNITFMPEDQEAHKEKVIVLPSGRMKPYPWTPEVLPLQIVTIGELAIIALPVECTTMSGRRLRETVQKVLGNKHTVISAPANAYTGYLTTREEYSAQEYEGSSTHFGPYTLNAYQQEFNRLAEGLKENKAVPPGPSPRRLDNLQSKLLPGVLYDRHPLFKDFGDMILDADESYKRGQLVRVIFWGANPRNDLLTQKSFLKVERQVGEDWDVVARDWDPETRLTWDRVSISFSKITIEWDIPKDSKPGMYRIRHFGNWKSFFTKRVIRYKGASRVFEVV